MFDAYGSKVVNKIFYKKENLPQHLKKFSFLSENGLTEIKLSKDFGTPDILSLQALNKQHDLKLSTPVSIQHYIFNDTETIIYSEIIKKIEVKEDQDRKYLLITISDN
ncbi:hypothetical protein ASG22_19940 [Chryseobacterium sp. Leaf405]|nr:hypothetical protein ASG22_19940 [Chryseobacterium sp. Leaf405]